MKLRLIRLFVLVGISTSFLLSCQCSSQNKSQQQKPPNPEQKFEQQREFLKKERASIQEYIKDRDLSVERTGTGLYYQLVNDSTGENINGGDQVLFDYDISLMNGTLLYSSEESGPRRLLIDREDAEIGLHECLKLMSLGDEGLFILPSHLAFGVAGDQKKVPPKTALVYELKILKVNKSKTN